MKHQMALIAHGGAGKWPERFHKVAQEGLREAVSVGWEYLARGASALETVEQVIRILEDNPIYDAGTGSFINERGEVEMDAIIADGREIRFGAVAAVRRVRNPITLARLVLTQTDHNFFVGDGADQLAAELGMPIVANIDMISPMQLRSYRKRKLRHEAATGTGTVGAVAMDRDGNIAAATSTGGTPSKPKGRVGDTPMFGAGGYADNLGGGASATGVGEQIMRMLLCKYAVDRMEAGESAQEAAQAAIAHIQQRIERPEVGIIMLDKFGRPGAAHTTQAMPIAWVEDQGSGNGNSRGVVHVSLVGGVLEVQQG